MPRPSRPLLASAFAVVVAALVLTGCTAAPDPVSSEPASVEPTPAPAETAPAAPTLMPEAAATDNLPYFATVVAGVWAGPEQHVGRAYVDALTAAGFDKAAMQVTRDETTVGNPVESLQFSVRWGQECLVGQVGPATGEPVTTVLPGLADGGCLVGQTRPIDW